MFHAPPPFIPVLRLSDIFEVKNATSSLTEGLVVLVESDDGVVGLLADEILGQQQVVIKNLTGSLGNAAGISGGAIMADGRVGLILDVDNVVKSESREYSETLS